jgi:hypothetical protein
MPICSKIRNTPRKAGIRPVQILVPDTRRPDFEEECRRRSRLVALYDAHDADLQSFIDEAVAEVDGFG